MTTMKAGVVGLGIGRSHVNGYRTHPSVTVTAAADVNPERLEQVGNEMEIPNLYSSAEEMFAKEELDVVSVALPNKLHKPMTLMALDAGCHVICEKPMAMNAAEAKEMRAAAEKAGKRLMINFSFRFKEQSFALKKAVDSGLLGDVYFARTIWLRRRGMPGFGGWFGRKELSGGGPLIDLGVHRLDLALWLMGYPKPVWVMGSTFDHIASGIAAQEGKEFDVEDMAVAMIKFENGAALELEASWAANIKERERMETRLIGTKGGLLQKNLDEGYVFDAEIYRELEGCQYDMKLHPPVPEACDARYHFVESLLADKPHMATADEGVIVMELLDAIYESAERNEPVKV